MLIRNYIPEESLLLRQVYHSSIHEVASRDYSKEQIEAWSPREFDPQAWIQRIERIKPWVVELDGVILAYADLQPDGYIDHFFVSGKHGGRGIGRILMQHILMVASERKLQSLFSNVSITAQPFFRHFGFEYEKFNTVTIRGVELSNATMRKQIIA